MPSLRLKHYNMKVEETVAMLGLIRKSIDKHNKMHSERAMLAEIREFRNRLHHKRTWQQFLQLEQIKAKKK